MVNIKVNLINLLVFAALCSVISTQSPIISEISTEQIRSIGEDIQLNCTIDNVRDYSVIWAKLQDTGSVVLSIRNSLTLSDKRYSVTENKNESTSTYSFQINKLEATDNGVYECQVLISPSEKVNAKVNLLIKHPAYILENQTPDTHTFGEGNVEEVICQADGYPKPSITWKRENNDVMPAGGNKFHGNILKLFPAHRSDRGVYYCFADNSMGVPDKKVIRIEIEFAPSITVPRPKIGQMKSYAIELECNVEAYPAPSISWFKNGLALQSHGNYRITNIATAKEITNSVLRISSVSGSDYGDYNCKATNILGHAEARINLLESVIPVPQN